MNIFQQLTEKSWLTPQAAVQELAHPGSVTLVKAKLGLWVFLSVVSMLFLLLIAAYAGRMTYEGWRPGPELGLLWFNTLALFCCSLAMQWATTAARQGCVADAWSGLMAGGVFAVVFLSGQLMAWTQLSSMGLFGLTIPAFAFFYLITGLHALHIAGGLAAWGITSARLWRGNEIARVQQSIELCTIYWHFMLGVWLVLFGLLFSGNNLVAALAICGLK